MAACIRGISLSSKIYKNVFHSQIIARNSVIFCERIIHVPVLSTKYLTLPLKQDAATTHVGYTSSLKRQACYSTSSASKLNFDELVKKNKVVVFIKGVPNEPRCGFSNAVVQVLRMHGVEDFDSHDVLEDENLRQGIKAYSNWPTIPQIYINGQFVGGCDVMLQLHQSGDLVEELQKAGIRSALLDKTNEK